MTEFEQQVVEHLTDLVGRMARVEAKIDNGIQGSIVEMKAWISGHPTKCPMVERRAIYMQPVLVALLSSGLTALAVKLIEKAFP